ncbi:MAG: hypothetical protein Tsb009_30580 [Planctomycetaceae bacterium]
MERGNQFSASSRRLKRRSSWLPIILGSGLFVVLLAAVMVIVNQTGKPAKKKNEAPVAQNEKRDVQSQELQSSGKPVQSGSTVAATNEKGTDNQLVPVASNPVVTTTAKIKTEGSQEELVRAYLEAGEFGAALDLASAAADANQKSQLLKQVANAQLKVDEFVPANAVVRRMPIRDEQVAMQQEQSKQAASAAGGLGADFSQLIGLIKSVTNGIWVEDDPDNGGSIESFDTAGGVMVDPNGLLSHLSRAELSGRLKSLGIRARNADLNSDMSQPSALRIVSLTRLEKEVRKRLEAGKPVVESMKHLAGLQKIEYVIVSQEDGEILIGGPAEGWKYNAQGLPVGQNNGRPTLQLDDFVTVFRTFAKSGPGIFRCTIEPTQQGLRNVRSIAEASKNRGPLSPAGTRAFVRRLNKAMGLQDVKVNGVPADSRVARVIVDADYRMKLIGIDKLDGGPEIPSYFDLLGKQPQKQASSLDAMRWWLTMKYDSVSHSKDRNVFQIQGSSVLCKGMNEEISPDGRRIQTGKADPSNLMFARAFTDAYQNLAKRDLVFADLQNVFDLSLVAALIRHEGIDRRLNWTGGVFAADGGYRPATYEPIKNVMSVSNHRVYNGRDTVIQVAGGVRADLMAVVRNPKMQRELPRLASLLQTARSQNLPENRWWWDVKK